MGGGGGGGGGGGCGGRWTAGVVGVTHVEALAAAPRRLAAQIGRAAPILEYRVHPQEVVLAAEERHVLPRPDDLGAQRDAVPAAREQLVLVRDMAELVAVDGNLHGAGGGRALLQERLLLRGRLDVVAVEQHLRALVARQRHLEQDAAHHRRRQLVRDVTVHAGLVGEQQRGREGEGRAVAAHRREAVVQHAPQRHGVPRGRHRHDRWRAGRSKPASGLVDGGVAWVGLKGRNCVC